MLRYTVPCIVWLTITMLGISLAHEIDIVTDVPLQIPAKRCLDSSGTRCVGRWLSDVAWSVACDEMRCAVFLGSADCVYVLDCSSPADTIIQRSFIPTQGCASALFYDHRTSHLYIGERQEGVSIWDIAQLSEPQAIGRFDTPGCACGLYVTPSNLFIADGDGGLRIVDISSPSKPYEVGYCLLPCACDVFVLASYAYVVAEGLEIIDIEMPAHPRKIAYWDSPGVIHDVFVAPPYVYTADDWGGLRIIDISEPTEPHEVGHYKTQGYAWAICVTNTYAYVAADHAGLRILDVSEPSQPREIGYHETPDDALNVAVLGDFILVTDVRYGLRVYRKD